jgi:hypothetical protein
LAVHLKGTQPLIIYHEEPEEEKREPKGMQGLAEGLQRTEYKKKGKTEIISHIPVLPTRFTSHAYNRECET